MMALIIMLITVLMLLTILLNYWTRTNDARLPGSAWSINFAIGAFDLEPKTNALHTRLVRESKIVNTEAEGAGNE